MASAGGRRVEFGLLGPLYVRGGVDGAPNARKLRTLLAILLTHAGKPMPVEVLMRELWSARVPPSGSTTLQTYILSLRKFFAVAVDLPAAEIAQQVLITRPGGYLLKADVVDLDIVKYDELVACGSAALATSDDEQGMKYLGAALDLWRGAPFEDIPVGPVLESKRREYMESRLMVTEYHLDAKLRLGMLLEVMSDLASLTVEHPLHEGMHARYMHALHLCGRRAQALQEYNRLRYRLVGELGLEPGAQVRRVHHAVLNADTSTDPGTHIRQPAGRTGLSQPLIAGWRPSTPSR